MRLFSVSLGILFCTGLCIGSPAWADINKNSRQRHYEMDKAAALASFDNITEQSCLKALHGRYRSTYTLNSPVTFDERLSLVTYDTLFWKGKDNRGLIFTGSVSDRSGAASGQVVCYYAITDSRLEFQSVYVIPKGKRETQAASMMHASVISLLRKE